MVLPVALGPAVDDALHDISTGPRSLASVALWALWAIGLTATLIPLPVTLTALRLGDRKSTRLNSSHPVKSRMPSSA